MSILILYLAILINLMDLRRISFISKLSTRFQVEVQKLKEEVDWRGKAVWFPKATLIALETMRVGDESYPSVVERLLKELTRLVEFENEYKAKVLRESQKK